MKLASLRDGSRDGKLVVVSADLTRCTDVPSVSPTLQAALDDWDRAGPMLEAVSRGVATGSQPTIRFHEHDAMSPLPRAYQWMVAAPGVDMTGAPQSELLLYLGGSGGFAGPRDPLAPTYCAHDLDLSAGVAVITGDVPMGASPAQAAEAILLVMLANEVTLRGLIPAERDAGRGYFQSGPPAAFSPVAVTPAALGDAWGDGRLHAMLEVDVNGTALGRLDAGRANMPDFPSIIAYAARRCPLVAGTIVGAGPVSNPEKDGSSRSVEDGGTGWASIAQRRAAEATTSGTAYLSPGDTLRIEGRAPADRSLFGAIEQAVAVPDA